MSDYKDADPTLQPIDPSTNEPLAASDQPGYYPGFSTLSQRAFWDPATRNTVDKRVKEPPPRRFFSVEEWSFWEAVFDHLIPQSDRIPERRIPLVPALDARLYEGRTAGYRYESMPPDREVYKLGIEAIDAESDALHSGKFMDLGHWQQEQVLQALHDRQPTASSKIWSRMSVHRFWQMITADASEAYYAHPWAWDEIGFGGPAYPRAYTRLERGEPEPWEMEEKRYDWRPPASSVSGEVELLHHLHSESEQCSHCSPKRNK